MGIFTTSPVTTVKRALGRYLPQTMCEATRLPLPSKTRALRVLYSHDAAFDYCLLDGEWFRLDGSADGVCLKVAERTEPEAIAAVIASDIAAWHRRIAYPLSTDAYAVASTEMERAESEDRITEAMDFLNSLSRAKFECSSETVELADILWNHIDDQIVDSIAEQKAHSQSRAAELAA